MIARVIRFIRPKALLLVASAALAGWAARAAQEPRYRSASGTELKLLLGADALGGSELELGEITFPPNADSGDHVHGSTEVFYVLSGELEHVVNGKSSLLKPGMVGSVRPPDRVRHKTGPGGPTKALVIWAPGGEAARIVSRWQAQK
jgi:quercetin dioxygenase-like cupin family protein